MHRHLTAWVVIALIVFTSAPYFYAAAAGSPGYVFGGILMNPMDGASYLAKMRQGWEGSWTFTLPYTAEESTGHYIFLYYLFLGHLARLVGLPLILVYHSARLLGAAALVLTLAILIPQTIPDVQKSRFALVLTVFGAGAGWLVFPWLGMTSDFWIAEAYPFLSAYTNPHFPLGLAIVISLLLNSKPGAHWIVIYLWPLVGALLLSVIFPFGIVVVLVVQAGLTLWDTFEFRKLILKKFVVLAAGGLPYLIYQYTAIQKDPFLSAWNLQNQTPSPAAWDILISFSPVLFFAIPGTVYIIRKNFTPGRILIVWALAAVLLIFFPFNLQRRFMLGLYIPLAMLAVFGWIAMSNIGFLKRWSGLVLFLFSMPTNIMILSAGLSGVRSLDSNLYLTQQEAKTMSWMADNLDKEAVILAAPETGSFIPAWSGHKVIYGHPFETIDAIENRNLVEKTLRGEVTLEEMNTKLNLPANYLFWGPREEAYSPSPPAGVALMTTFGNVSVFKIP